MERGPVGSLEREQKMTMKTTVRVDVSLQSSMVSLWWTIDAAVMFDFASRRI